MAVDLKHDELSTMNQLVTFPNSCLGVMTVAITDWALGAKKQNNGNNFNSGRG